MYERFTDRARKVMQLANQEAQRFNHEYIAPCHILAGIAKEGSGIAAAMLTNLGVVVLNKLGDHLLLGKVRKAIEKIIASGPDMVVMGRLPQTPRAKKVVECAIDYARSLRHNYIGTEHILMGLLSVDDTVVAAVLPGMSAMQVGEQVKMTKTGTEPSIIEADKMRLMEAFTSSCPGGWQAWEATIADDRLTKECCAINPTVIIRIDEVVAEPMADEEIRRIREEFDKHMKSLTAADAKILSNRPTTEAERQRCAAIARRCQQEMMAKGNMVAACMARDIAAEIEGTKKTEGKSE